jgi:Na+-driven multidrug efflux pump
VNDQVTEAKVTACVNILQTITINSCLGLLYYFFWDNLGGLMTGNEDVIKRMKSMMVYATLFFFAYSLQICFQSILRGLGYQSELARYSPSFIVG